MSWVVLIVAGLLEAVWATALGRSEGFTRLVPTAVFFVALALSMAGLGVAMSRLPVGTSYTVWVGIGAVVTVLFAAASGDEPLTAIRAVFLAAIVGGVVGLKLTS
jgi:quaternary ammonium compound-resistance protein SugE